MKSSRVLRSWREYGIKAVAVLLTALLATQMVGTPAFASLEQSQKAAEEQTADVSDVMMDETQEQAATADEPATQAKEAPEAAEGGEPEEAAPTQEPVATEPEETPDAGANSANGGGVGRS